MRKIAGILFPFFAIAALALSPSQQSVALGGFRVAAGEFLLLPAFALGYIGRRLILPPIECFAFIGLVAVAAVCTSPLDAAAIKETVQIALYFCVAWSVVAGTLSDNHWRRAALVAFLASGAIIVSIAMWQYFAPSPDVFPLNLREGLCVRGLFANNNVLSGYLALLAPVAFSLSLGPGRWSVRLALAALVLSSLFVTLSGPALLATCVAIAALAFGRGRVWGTATVAALLALFLYAAPHTPRDNFTTVITSALPYRVDDGAVAYAEDATLEWRAGDPARRYPEWQAAAMMALERPLVGVGPGSYQKSVGAYYDAVPRATGPNEPDTQNLYLVIASTMGLPALAAFLAILAASFADGVRSDDALARGAAASVAAFTVASVFHPLLVRGIGIPLILVLVFARSGRLLFSREKF